MQMQATLAVVNWIVFLKEALHFLELSATPKKDNDLAQKYKAPYVPWISSHRFTKKRHRKLPLAFSLRTKYTPITWCNPRFTDLQSRLQQTAAPRLREPVRCLVLQKPVLKKSLEWRNANFETHISVSEYTEELLYSMSFFYMVWTNSPPPPPKLWHCNLGPYISL